MSRSTALMSVLALAMAGTLSTNAATAAPSAGASAALLAGDLDGDGAAGAADCAPTNPAVHPGAPDRPDLAFTDTNCDGIDGSAADAVFVSVVDGNDAGTGTRTSPYKTLGTAIPAAASAGKDVYVQGGSYTGTAQLADGVGLYGGYARDTWARAVDETTTISGAPAAFADGDVGVVLQQLRLSGQPDASGNSYGLRAINASQVVLERATVLSAAAGAPLHGSTGATGSLGAGGAGRPGGFGGCGPGVLGQQGTLTSGPGAPGANGANAALAVPAAAAWGRPAAPTGASGQPGGGGSGGQGGTGGGILTILCGGTGGSGGSGGGAGSPGAGGATGAGSFGVYSYNSSVVVDRSVVNAGAGGAGGDGGSGGFGGGGTLGMPGFPGQCENIIFFTCAANGFPGGNGAAGGRGGGGGGGVGGPSTAVYQGGATSGSVFRDSSASTSAGGLGGLQGNGSALRAPSGQTVHVLTAAGAPANSSYDFDSDGVLDRNDACPADPRGSADANGDGCAEAPETTITSGPADNAFLLSNATSIGFGSSETGSTFACATDGGDAATCAAPRALSRLAAGTHVFDVWATDGAGTADPTSATRVFTVPRNNTALTHSSGWTRKTGSGYFLNSYSTTSRLGKTLSTSGSGVRRIALVATKAPGHGKVGVYLGRTLLKKVSLASTRTKKKQLIPIASFTAGRSGTIKVKVLTSGKPVRIEGLGVATR